MKEIIKTHLLTILCIYRSEPASCTENFRQAAGENPPPRWRRTSLFWTRF